MEEKPQQGNPPLSPLKGYMRAFLRWLLVFSPVFIPFLILVYTGIMGIDFGYHWDEVHTIALARQYVRKSQIFPGWYIYPTMISLVALSVTLVYALPLILKQGFVWQVVRLFLLDEVFPSSTYHLNVRKALLVITALALIWVYLYKLERKRHWLEALLAASILGFSWEVAYHARFLTVDGMVMQFGALVTLLSLLAVRRPEQRGFWLRAAAVVAGLGTSTKYPAGLLLVPVLVAAYLSWNRKQLFKKFIPLLLILCTFFAISYLVITKPANSIKK